MKKNFAIALGMFFAVSMTLSAQGGLNTTQTVHMTVEGKALIAAMGGDVHLSLSGATQAGANPTQDFGRDAETRLRMSSLTSGTDTRTITASITKVGLVAGTNTDFAATNSRLHLRLLPPATANATNFKNFDATTLAHGTSPIETVTALLDGFDLSKNASITLVSGLKTAWTGTNPGDGYVVEYVYTATGVGAPQPTNVEVTYTISGL